MPGLCAYLRRRHVSSFYPSTFEQARAIDDAVAYMRSHEHFKCPWCGNRTTLRVQDKPSPVVVHLVTQCDWCHRDGFAWRLDNSIERMNAADICQYFVQRQHEVFQKVRFPSPIVVLAKEPVRQLPPTPSPLQPPVEKVTEWTELLKRRRKEAPW